MTSNSVPSVGTKPPSSTGSAVPPTDVPVAVMVPNVVALAMWKAIVPSLVSELPLPNMRSAGGCPVIPTSMVPSLRSPPLKVWV